MPLTTDQFTALNHAEQLVGALNTASKAAQIDAAQAALLAAVEVLHPDTPGGVIPATAEQLQGWLLQVQAAVEAGQPTDPPVTDPPVVDPPADPPVVTPPAATDGLIPAGGLFTGPRSVWIQDVSGAPLASNSAAVVSNLVAQMGGKPAYVNEGTWSTPFYVVGKDQPKVVPSFSPSWYESAACQAARLAGVPIPDGVQTQDDTDKEIAIWCPDTDQLWEIWVLAGKPGAWSVGQVGRIDHVSTSDGRFALQSGAQATNLPRTGGMIQIADVQAGVIPHALCLAIPQAASGRFSYPALRTDGPSSNANAPLEGQRFRLDPSINVDSLGLATVAGLVAKALQRYGLIITDTSGAVNFYAEPDVTAGTLYWGKVKLDVTGIPWDRMQAITPDWGKPS